MSRTRLLHDDAGKWEIRQWQPTTSTVGLWAGTLPDGTAVRCRSASRGRRTRSKGRCAVADRKDSIRRTCTMTTWGLARLSWAVTVWERQCWNWPKTTGGGVVSCRNVWNFAHGLKFKADFHSKMSVCRHEIGDNSNPGEGNGTRQCLND